MSTNANLANRSFLVRFCDGFLQDRNIKWMLALGLLILLGSSVLLVSAHWDSYTPVWKYLIFLAYTMIIFGAGQWARNRLALPRTATALQVLTVLLLPITFFALHWFRGEDGGGMEPEVHLLLLGLNLGLSVLTAGRISHHFLRGHQPTFLASFLILALAGTYVPGLPPAWAPEVALALWAVFAAGSVKVNRHVFWLVEENRQPRIFGFFPILLLGGQFLALFVLHAPGQISLEWFGFGLVLVSIPLLWTADAVARVFQQRTGDLVRPLPWAIIGPLWLGLTLCAAGVCTAGASVVPPNKPHALVLASALAAVMMLVAARRTGKQAFVWAMLAGVMLTYNFSPAFFTSLVRTLLDQGAQMVHEKRLPIAFYGLTYLPLLMTVMTVAWLRPADILFSRPLRQFSMGLGCVMLAVSLGHVKALFPVALCMTGAFALQVAMFRDGKPALLAIVSWIVAAAGMAPFLDKVLGLPLPLHPEIYGLGMGAGLLLIAGRFVDSFLGGLLSDPFESEWAGKNVCRGASLLLSFGLAMYWLACQLILPWNAGALPVPILLSILLLAHVMYRINLKVSMASLVLVNWQVFTLVVQVCGSQGQTLADLQPGDLLPLCLPVALIGSASLLAWQSLARAWKTPGADMVFLHLVVLRYLTVLAVTATLAMPGLTEMEIILAGAGFALAVLAEICTACREQNEGRVWIAEALVLAGVGYLAHFHVIVFGHGLAMFVVLALGILLWLMGEWARGRDSLGILTGPLQQTSLVLPLAAVGIGIYRHLFQDPVWLGANSLALLLAAGFYFWRGLEKVSKPFLMLAGAILNIALILLWRELVWNDPQFFMIPIGISILALVQLLRQEIPEKYHDPLRYLGALVILVSPIFHIVGGSWIHLFSLMVASVGVVLLAIGLRVRALMYTGTAFLVADLVAMVVRGSIDNPNVLWLAGLALGAAVIALGALCERNREVLIERMRVLSEALQNWQ